MPLAACAQAAKPIERVNVDLISDTATIQPGKPFTLGIHFTLAPSWHIYWKNPGDAGLAPRVTFNLPTGMAASEIEFPTPQRFVQPGDIHAYGYENDVMLLATIQPGADLQVGQSITINADVSWLVCADICVPGKKSLSITLPIGGKAEPSASANLVQTWRDKIPVQVESIEPRPVHAKPIELKNGVGDTEIVISKVLLPVTVIPGVANGLELTISPAEQRADGVVIPLHVNALAGETLPNNFRVLLIRDDTTRPYDLKIDVQTDASSAAVSTTIPVH